MNALRKYSIIKNTIFFVNHNTDFYSVLIFMFDFISELNISLWKVNKYLLIYNTRKQYTQQSVTPT